MPKTHKEIIEDANLDTEKIKLQVQDDVKLFLNNKKEKIKTIELSDEEKL